MALEDVLTFIHLLERDHGAVAGKATDYETTRIDVLVRELCIVDLLLSPQPILN